MLRSAHHAQEGALHREKMLLFSTLDSSAMVPLVQGAPARRVGHVAMGAAVQNWDLPALVPACLLVMAAAAGALWERRNTNLQDKGSTT